MSAWAALSTGFDRDPRIVELSNDAQLLYLRLLLYTVEHETDGVFPSAAVAMCDRNIPSPDQCLDQCLDQGLIKRMGGHATKYRFPFHVWSRYQATKEDIERKRAGGRARTRRWRDASRDAPQDSHPPVTNALVTRPHNITERSSNNSQLDLATGAREINGEVPPTNWNVGMDALRSIRGEMGKERKEGRGQ